VRIEISTGYSVQVSTWIKETGLKSGTAQSD